MPIKHTKLKKHYEPIFFGIKMITCNRKKDRPVFELVSEAIQSILDQTYPHWKLFLIGDLYEPREEFARLVSMLPPDKVIARNLIDHGAERLFLPNHDLVMRAAGHKASTYCLDLMQAMGIRYVAVLDDDDMWFPRHLEHIANEYRKFPPPAFVATMANYRYQAMLPNVKYDEYGNFTVPQFSRNVVHSAVSWDFKRMPFRHRNMVFEVPWFGEYGDADMWDRMTAECEERGWPMSLVPEVTVEYR